jgi:hypothetical protein
LLWRAPRTRTKPGWSDAELGSRAVAGFFICRAARGYLIG